MSAYLLDKENNVCSTDVNSPCYKNHELLMERVNILEKAYINLEIHKAKQDAKVEVLEELVYEVKAKQRDCDRKPHKCPVCEGDGTYREDGKIYNGRVCNACEGKGIVFC